MSDKLAALAAEIDKANTLPEDWSTLLRWATINELTNFSMGDREDPAFAIFSEEVRRRCQQRYRLGLKESVSRKFGQPGGDWYRCAARKPNSECSCGQDALETLSADDLVKLDRAEARRLLSSLAGPLHKKRRRLRPKPSPPAQQPPTPAPALLALPRGDDPPPPVHPPQKRGRRIWTPKHQHQDPPHPLTWAAFKAKQDDRIDWTNETF